MKRNGVPQGREAEKTLAELLLQQQLVELRTTTEHVAHLAGQAVNGVLLSTLATLDANGQANFDFDVAFGSLALATFGDAVVVASGAPQVSAPGGGAGVCKVGAGMGRVINMTGRSLTVYGTAGTQITLEVFTKPQPPSFGPVLP